MPNYSYTAKDFYGKSVKGNLEAENEKDFLDKIHQKGLYCTNYSQSYVKRKKSVKKFKTKRFSIQLPSAQRYAFFRSYSCKSA